MEQKKLPKNLASNKNKIHFSNEGIVNVSLLHYHLQIFPLFAMPNFISSLKTLNIQEHLPI